MTLSHILLILGAYSSHSPYAHIGAQRELLMLMAVEPMFIIASIGFFEAYGTFYIGEMLEVSFPGILLLPGVFIGFVYILTFRLRKSPFDLSTSHHAHQELVKGVNTEFAGPILGMVEILHLYELILMLGFMYLFFAFNPLLALIVIAIVYVAEIIVDNATCRVKWQLALKSAWLVTLIAGAGNIIAISML
jgi:formate hydrogenlyase subunit 4